jgi:hypothetical protein
MIEGVDFSQLTSDYIAGLREEAEKKLGGKQATFPEFCAFVVELMTANISKCGGKNVQIPKHITNLISFSVSGKEWQKLIGYG